MSDDVYSALSSPNEMPVVMIEYSRRHRQRSEVHFDAEQVYLGNSKERHTRPRW